MKLIIEDKPYPIFDAIAGVSLGDIRSLQRETKQAGVEISIARVRTYLLTDVLKNTVPFGHVDSDEKVLCMQALVWLCWRHAGEDRAFDQTLAVPVQKLKVEIEDGDLVKEAPKEPTDSVPGDDTATTT